MQKNLLVIAYIVGASLVNLNQVAPAKKLPRCLELKDVAGVAIEKKAGSTRTSVKRRQRMAENGHDEVIGKLDQLIDMVEDLSVRQDEFEEEVLEKLSNLDLPDVGIAEGFES